MSHVIDSDGLRRLVKLELSRLLPGTREEAQRLMRGRVGAYDRDGTIIEAGINSYFSTRATRN
ncbi:hypothetical protein [Kordiimonas pumila]|uniref:Uncharacterized protein n=1 Tax=Kordiimonas pumila TaxID=2161677 RepID=A0ABV7D3F0_9PROT|nr:hypothetical protein [Kordiimonas pumila]